MAIAFTLITLAFGPVVGRNPHSLHDRARGPSIGTDGSNPARSSAESAANLTPGPHGGDAASEEIVWARRRAESHVKPRGRVRTELTESAELEVRIHSPPAKSLANSGTDVEGWRIRRCDDEGTKCSGSSQLAPRGMRWIARMAGRVALRLARGVPDRQTAGGSWRSLARHQYVI